MAQLSSPAELAAAAKAAAATARKLVQANPQLPASATVIPGAQGGGAGGTSPGGA